MSISDAEYLGYVTAARNRVRAFVSRLPNTRAGDVVDSRHGDQWPLLRADLNVLIAEVARGVRAVRKFEANRSNESGADGSNESGADGTPSTGRNGQRTVIKATGGGADARPRKPSPPNSPCTANSGGGDG